MSEGGKFIGKKISTSVCTAQHFGLDGLPCQCDQDPVWELTHSNGRSFHICEYHIEVFWNVWLSFRSAVRDLWPIRIEISS
jgi:hypothetical protein